MRWHERTKVWHGRAIRQLTWGQPPRLSRRTKFGRGRAPSPKKSPADTRRSAPWPSSGVFLGKILTFAQKRYNLRLLGDYHAGIVYLLVVFAFDAE